MKFTEKKTKKSRIRYGKKDLLDESAFNARETKFRVTMYLDLDVLDEIRTRAKKRGLPYQTYLNQFLRETHLGDAQDEHIRKIVREELVKAG